MNVLLRKLFEVTKKFFSSNDQGMSQEDVRYLNGAVDIYDLEYRQKVVEQGRGKRVCF